MDEQSGATASVPLAPLIGQRWPLSVVAALSNGPERRGALTAAIPGLSASLLTRRLRTVGAVGILERRALQVPASARVYALTTWGAALGPILNQLDFWAARASLERERPSQANPTSSCGAL